MIALEKEERTFSAGLRSDVYWRMGRLVGLVVKASATRAEDPGFDSHLRRGDFSGSVESYQ